ncbi:MAG: NADH-quinone oxidoreductase subunit M [Mycobacteriales bacterium]
MTGGEMEDVVAGVTTGRVLLVAVIALPALGAGVLALRPARFARNAASGAVAFSGLTMLASLGLVMGRQSGADRDWQSVDLSWVPAIGLRFHIGVDGISLPLVLLTTVLTFLCALYTMHSMPAPGRPGTMLSLVLLLEVGMVGTFLARDLLLFFVFFEIVLVPMYFLIAVWGGTASRHAATKFVLYTLLGSVLLLVGILVIYAGAGTLDMGELAQGGAGAGMAKSTQILAFALVFLGLAVKSPLWPLHTWLPDAHTEAPTVGSVLLAGVLLKMGTYGIVRIGISILPEGARRLAPTMAVLAVAGILVGALCCYVQTDLKRLIAYSSVGHMGFVLLGLSTLTATGVQAALIGNIAHGVITGLLFFLVGGIKDRFGTSEMSDLGGGIGTRLPLLSGLLTFTAIASLGLPGLAAFWGEAFAIAAAYRPDAGLARMPYVVLAGLAAIGAALAAAYFLRMLRIVVARPPDANPRATGVRLAVADVTPLEAASWAPLVVLALAIGLFPALVLTWTGPAVDLLIRAYAG